MKTAPDLRARREAVGRTQVELAVEAEVAPLTLRRAEQGKAIRTRIMARIEAALRKMEVDHP